MANQYLLDTTLFLLWLEDKGKLDDTIYDILADGDNIIYVSSASIWEIDIKKGLGEIKLDNLDIDAAIEENAFHLLRVSSNALEIAKELPSQHNDPFNRTIIAQAIDENLTLITLDHTILEYPKVKTLQI